METSEQNIWFERMWEHLRSECFDRLDPTLSVYDDVTVIDGWGYVLKNNNLIFPANNKLGWSTENIGIMRKKYEGVDLDALPEAGQPDERIDVLLTFPGAYTYGHWPIDIVARVARALAVFELSQVRFIVPGPLPSWAMHYLSVFDIAKDQLIEIPDGHRYQSRKLIVPFLRSSDYLPPFPHATAFLKLKNWALSEKNSNVSTKKKIFVKHKAQTSFGMRPILANSNEIERRLSLLGFASICPAEMELREQVEVFSGAELIVGEDSSALHNVIYSSSAKLIVISTSSRKNLLHLSICRLLGHECRYICIEDDGRSDFSCDPSRVEEEVQVSRKGYHAKLGTHNQ